VKPSPTKVKFLSLIKLANKKLARAFNQGRLEENCQCNICLKIEFEKKKKEYKNGRMNRNKSGREYK
jgi:hypothetical protein